MMRNNNLKSHIDIDISAEDIRNKAKSAEKFGYYYIVTIGKKEVYLIDKDINNTLIAIRHDKKITNVLVTDLIMI